MDARAVDKLIAKLGSLQSDLEEKRDALSAAIGVIRSTRQRLERQLEANKMLDNLEKELNVVPLVLEAGGYLYEFAQSVISGRLLEMSSRKAGQTSDPDESDPSGLSLVPPVDLEEPEPVTEASGDPKTAKPVSVASMAVRIMVAAFERERIPGKIEEVLELDSCYGRDWRSFRFTRLGGFMLSQHVTMGEDLESPKSYVRAVLRNCAKRILQLNENTLPGQPAPILTNLYVRLRKAHKWEEIKQAFESWGLIA